LTQLIVNENWQEGQLSSVRAALRSLPPGLTDGLLLCLVDHPLISAELVAALVERFYESGKLVVVPTYQGKRGHPVIFSSNLYGELMEASNGTGARSVVWGHAADVLEVPTTEEGVILNLNDAESVNRALGAESE
jgi:molybdenum cofactor cytidylyltransferase